MEEIPVSLCTRLRSVVVACGGAYVGANPIVEAESQSNCGNVKRKKVRASVCKCETKCVSAKCVILDTGTYIATTSNCGNDVMFKIIQQISPFIVHDISNPI